MLLHEFFVIPVLQSTVIHDKINQKISSKDDNKYKIWNCRQYASGGQYECTKGFIVYAYNIIQHLW